METDRGHIRCMLQTPPAARLGDFDRMLKSCTAYRPWETCLQWLARMRHRAAFIPQAKACGLSRRAIYNGAVGYDSC